MRCAGEAVGEHLAGVHAEGEYRHGRTMTVDEVLKGVLGVYATARRCDHSHLS